MNVAVGSDDKRVIEERERLKFLLVERQNSLRPNNSQNGLGPNNGHGTAKHKNLVALHVLLGYFPRKVPGYEIFLGIRILSQFAHTDGCDSVYTF
jgi:hypothetical protein